MSAESNNAIPAATPIAQYHRDLAAGKLQADPEQARAMAHVQRLYHELTTEPEEPAGLIGRLLSRRPASTAPSRGLYLWGPVGRGKTYLVDAFFESLPFEQKLRIHFHSFMRKIHHALKQYPNEQDPLKRVAAQWSGGIRVLCLDEFHVGDITDAMILARLLEALFENGVTLVTTSNEAPGNLYKDGLQRQQFLPAIELIEQHLEVVELAGEVDYRLRALEQASVYYCPHDSAVERELAARFAGIAIHPEIDGSIEVEGRRIKTRGHAEGVVWFEFGELCESARSTNDYIEIALCHHTIFISDVPRLDDDNNDAARRFINLIDELYDRNVNIILSAAVPATELYRGRRLHDLFKRTASRLQEMQSHDYLARPHLCD